MQKSEEITLILSGTAFVAATVSLDFREGREAIYYSPKENVTTPLGQDLNEGIIAGRIDHFSFHVDGKVHVKHKEKNRAKSGSNKPPLYREIGKLPGGLLPKNSRTITPLIVDSVFQNHEEWPLPTINNTRSDSYPWAFKGLREISLLVFLIDHRLAHTDLIQKKEFQQLILHQAAFRIPFLSNWELLVCASPQTLPEIFPESLSTFGLSCNRELCPHFSRHIVAGPDPLTFEHLGYGRSIVMPRNEEG